MTIAKIAAIVVLLTNLSCNNMEKQDFKVFGDESVLNDCKINVKTYNQNSENIQNLLFEGKINKVPSIKGDIKYEIYLSYKDSLVSEIDFENILDGEETQINHLYITKNKENVRVRFVVKEEFLKLKGGYVKVFTTINEYFNINNIYDDKLKQNKKNIFFNLNR